jgi:hypothetical protein
MRYAKFISQGLLCGRPSASQNGPGLFFGKFVCPLAFAPIVSAVSKGIGHILFMRFPGQVSLGDAPEVAFAAGVGGLMLWCWRVTLGRHTEHSANNHLLTRLAATGSDSIPLIVSCKRPDEASFARIGENNFQVEFLCLTPSSSAAFGCMDGVSHAVTSLTAWLKRRVSVPSAPRLLPTLGGVVFQ